MFDNPAQFYWILDLKPKYESGSDMLKAYSNAKRTLTIRNTQFRGNALKDARNFKTCESSREEYYELNNLKGQAYTDQLQKIRDIEAPKFLESMHYLILPFQATRLIRLKFEQVKFF